MGASIRVLSWIQQGVKMTGADGVDFSSRPPPAFNQGISLASASSEELKWVEKELSRLMETGAISMIDRSDWISKIFLVPKPDKAVV